MSRHFVHRYKYSHDTRRKSLFNLLNQGLAKIVEKSKAGWLFETVDNYRVSRKGKLVKL